MGDLTLLLLLFPPFCPTFHLSRTDAGDGAGGQLTSFWFSDGIASSALRFWFPRQVFARLLQRSPFSRVFPGGLSLGQRNAGPANIARGLRISLVFGRLS